MMDEERLADLGALLVFRHWLRQQLAELAGEADASALEHHRCVARLLVAAHHPR